MAETTTLKVSACYTKRGFFFRVDYVNEWGVFVRRWAVGKRRGKPGVKLSVTHDVWRSEMHDAKEVSKP
jgi:hypothetical protein